MQVKFSGCIRYANGEPVSDVTVRIFDQDTAGNGDDDLTITPGLSDENGAFSLTYEPLHYLDYHTIHLKDDQELTRSNRVEGKGLRMPDLGDNYLPYLRFNYTFNGLVSEHHASMGVFQTEFYLLVNPPVEFLPS